ncbi:glycosyltransferase family 2 protein [Geofilum rubicundum]|uniref:Glycosyltransferase family protein n=1 Tax=Geofilum rubicundum JCM 15548 TaxID=1236989 RepID=A0A0E9LVX8_9BACT|nr:glycosyltransferase family 2 protein [Geofilum rubicundum]GAO29747.1 glycosyltransferase family protein [Geofilum rubicundum JCM 15548]
MITVCVPVYNYHVTPLAMKLSKQAHLADFPVEILFLDDGSDQAYAPFNDSLSKLNHIRFISQKNQGRSRTRNHLAEMALGEYLIFMDCDCDVPDDFIAKYAAYCRPGQVVVGGLQYHERPQDPSLWLRWKVGVKREVRSLKRRQAEPYASFLSSNFMVPKNLMSKLAFDENMRGYGHEDTLFGLALKRHKVPLVHIENAVFHQGIDRADAYLKKLEQSIDNLVLIGDQAELAEGFKLFRYYLFIKKAGLTRLFNQLFNRVEPAMKKQFLQGSDSLLLLDLYKLGLLCQKSRHSR